MGPIQRLFLGQRNPSNFHHNFVSQLIYLFTFSKKLCDVLGFFEFDMISLNHLIKWNLTKVKAI